MEQDLSNTGGSNNDNNPKSPRIVDALLAGAGIILFWFVAGFLLKFIKPYFSDRDFVYVSGFLTQSVMGAVLISLMLARGFKLRDLGYRAAPVPSMLGSVGKAFGLIILFYIIYASILTSLGLTPPGDTVYTFLLSQRSLVFVALNLFLAAVLAPVLEETVFRGLIYQSLRSKLGPWPSALLSAALFSALHLDIWGFATRMFLGVVMAYLYEKYRSVYPSMVLHSVNNGFIFLIFLAVNPSIS